MLHGNRWSSDAKNSATEVDTNLILDECAIVGQANHEFNRCEAKAENWKQQLRQQDVELHSRSQNYEEKNVCMVAEHGSRLRYIQAH